MNDNNKFEIYNEMFEALDIDGTGFIPTSEVSFALENLGITFDNDEVIKYVIEITD